MLAQIHLGHEGKLIIKTYIYMIPVCLKILF